MYMKNRAEFNVSSASTEDISIVPVAEMTAKSCAVDPLTSSIRRWRFSLDIIMIMSIFDFHSEWHDDFIDIHSSAASFSTYIVR